MVCGIYRGKFTVGRGEGILQLAINCTARESEGLGLGETHGEATFCRQPTWCCGRSYNEFFKSVVI